MTEVATDRKRILLVDDESGFTTLAKIQLEATGDYQVRVENDSREALAAAVEFKPDVILLDIVMPGLDGGDVSALLGETPETRDVPVILVTALLASEDESAGMGAAFGDRMVLSKPVETERLVHAIEQVAG